MYTDAVNNNIKKFPYSSKAEALIQKLNEFKPTKIILFGLTDIILENFSVLLKSYILNQEQTICIYKLTNYNNEILVGADKGNIIAIKVVDRLNMKIDVSQLNLLPIIGQELLEKLSSGNKAYTTYNCTYLHNSFTLLVIGTHIFEIKETERGKRYGEQIINRLLDKYNFIFVHSIYPSVGAVRFWEKFKKGDQKLYDKLHLRYPPSILNDVLITK